MTTTTTTTRTAPAPYSATRAGGPTPPARPAGRFVSARRQRTVSRALHLLGAGLIGTYLYAPPAVAAPLRIWLQLLVVPALTATGLFLWKQAQLRRLAAAINTRTHRAPAAPAARTASRPPAAS